MVTEVGELMRRMACAALMSASLVVVGAWPALSENVIDKKTDDFVDHIFDPPAAEETPPVQRSNSSPAPDWQRGGLKPHSGLPDRKPSFHERFKDQAAYEQAVLSLLRTKHPDYFSNPNGEGVRLAKIILPAAFEREDEPNVAAEDIKTAVEKFLQDSKKTTEARKKANQRIAKRPSALQEVVSDPEVAGETAPDYGEIASTLLSIGGAVAPIMRGARVPSARPSIRAPAPAHVPAPPVVRPPTSSSTITGSDIRLKRDIAEVGRTPGGLHLYRFRYLWSDTVYVGVMAQEVLTKTPAAVIQGDDGYLRVDYGQLGLKFQTFEEWSATAWRHGS